MREREREAACLSDAVLIMWPCDDDVGLWCKHCVYAGDQLWLWFQRKFVWFSLNRDSCRCCLVVFSSEDSVSVFAQFKCTFSVLHAVCLSVVREGKHRSWSAIAWCYDVNYIYHSFMFISAGFKGRNETFLKCFCLQASAEISRTLMSDKRWASFCV